MEFKHDESVPYAMKVMRGLRLFDRSMKLQFRPNSKHNQSSSGNNSPNPMGGPMMQGGMMPNGGLITPPPLQRSMSLPMNVPFPPPHMMNQFNQGMPFQGQPGLLGVPPQGMGPGGMQRQGSMPGGRYVPSPLSDERDGRDRSHDRNSSGSGHHHHHHHHGSSSGHHHHQSRDRERRGNDLRSYSPSLGQSPEFARDHQRRGSFHNRDNSPSQQGRYEGDHHMHGHEGGRHHMERGRHGQHDSRADRSDRYRDREDRPPRHDSQERGRYRDDSRERHDRRGRYR